MTIRHLLQTAGTLALAAGFYTTATPASAQEGYMGEIRMVGYSFCPRDWANANGQLLAIADNQALFSLYGSAFGGDGRTTFGLPDLRGRQPIHTGAGPGVTNYPVGRMGGTETNTLTVQNLASHTHQATSTLRGSTSTADSGDPTDRALGTQNRSIYVAGGPGVDMEAGSVITTVANTGTGQPVNNRDPFMTVRFCVLLEGAYPPRN